ncbi:MRP-L47-domain-containing protein [Cylindrobasidium torrendii FP15055 ss-10]|uniref:Large ribosomal subunit protein uL29m n=1 Tax=Cylindrobasidium torrendii FP15055 ss-10 TaxID=1314674 RepID=A0A0D7AYZ1_9AGAR|nr:MRP-L47-domain-containing protein [Cylindrobasidium torrendii FP15055 ss-10]
MFSVLRTAASRSCPRVLARRTLATVPDVPAAAVDPESDVPDAAPKFRIPTNPNHGLYHFFRRDKNGEYTTIGGTHQEDIVNKGGALGRAWLAPELRLKSFEDLHVLWYVLLRERNLLQTQQYELRRQGLKAAAHFGWRKKDVRKGMARIKYVLNERRLAYQGAVELHNQEITRALDAEVHKALLQDYEATRKETEARKSTKERWTRAEKRARKTAAEKTTPPIPQTVEQPEVLAA